MKTAVWYTSTFVVVFVYLYVYLVQYIRGAEIRAPPHTPLRRIGPNAGSPAGPPSGSPWNGPRMPFHPNANAGPGQVAPSAYRDHLIAASVAAAAVVPAPPPLDFEYHDYERMTDWLKQMSAAYPNLTALYSIGKSVQGKRLPMTALFDLDGRNKCQTHYLMAAISTINAGPQCSSTGLPTVRICR